ncbi:MAG: tyrosine-type recombinase/integrase [Pilosibacter sp.]
MEWRQYEGLIPRTKPFTVSSSITIQPGSRTNRRFPLIPFHGLRHTAATLLIANGVNIRTVSGRLGHTNTSTTLNIYSHALEEFDRKASDVLADTLMKKA